MPAGRYPSRLHWRPLWHRALSGGIDATVTGGWGSFSTGADVSRCGRHGGNRRGRQRRASPVARARSIFRPRHPAGPSSMSARLAAWPPVLPLPAAEPRDPAQRLLPPVWARVLDQESGASAFGFSAAGAVDVATGSVTGAGAGDRYRCCCHCRRRNLRDRLGRGRWCRRGGGGATAALCRTIEPVTESNPCSRTLMRENSRSRSPLSVSMAEASRRTSFSLCLATDWICCDCRARSDRRKLVAPQFHRRLAGEDRDGDCGDRGDTPHRKPQQRGPVEMFFLGQKTGGRADRARRSTAASRLVALLCHRTSSAPRGPPNHTVNLNRKSTLILNSVHPAGEPNGFPSRAKRFINGDDDP